jgi:hypothetical protein
MAKARLTTKSGTVITIEGTQEEVAGLIAQFGAARPAASSRKRHPPSNAKSGPVALISELIDGGFFKKPKELGAIKLALEEQGHYYPVTTLSPLLLRLVRKRELRRIKDKKRWLYVG